jgi:hypothetical protein
MAKFAVQNIFGERVCDGHTTEKIEAIIQEAVEFVGKAFQIEVSRSTVQAWLNPLRASMPDKKPKIHARK